MTLLSSLSHRPFALLWSGQTTSLIGDSLYKLAIVWWILLKTGSAAVMGKVLICSFTPMLLFLIIGGVMVDKLHRVSIMIASDLLRGFIVAVVALLAFTHLLEVWHIYIASLTFGFVNAFFQPAYAAILTEITPSKFMTSANSLTSLSREIAAIVGPALSAFIVALGGTSTVFALNSLSFFISALCLVPLLTISVQQNTKSSSLSMLNDAREGITTVLKLPWLWITITIAALTNITLVAPVTIALPFLVKKHLYANVDVLGLVYSMLSLGSTIAAVWLSRGIVIPRRGLVAYIGWLIAGITAMTFGLPITLIGLLIAALINGASLAIFNLIWIKTIQELIPNDMLGRVSSISLLGSYVLLPIGLGIAGWATEQIGAPMVLIIGGGLTTLLVLLGLIQPAVQDLR